MIVNIIWQGYENHSEHVREKFLCPPKPPPVNQLRERSPAKPPRRPYSRSPRGSPDWLRARLHHWTGHGYPGSQTQGGRLHAHSNRDNLWRLPEWSQRACVDPRLRSPWRCPYRGQVGPLRPEHARRSQPRARIGRERRKPQGSGACHRYWWANGPNGPDCAGHGRRNGAWLHPRSATRGHQRRESEGRLQRPLGHVRPRIVRPG
jgi:hypothetical protein